MSEAYEEASPRAKRRPMLVGGVAAVLLGCCALLFVAALVFIADPFGLNIFARLTGRYDAAATVMPADTGLYAGVNLLNVNTEEIGRLVQPFVEAVGDGEVENLDGAQNEIAAEIESELGIDIETDVVPWIGQYLGFGVTGFTFDNFGAVESADWILAVEARDRGAADEFLLELRDALSESSGNEIGEQGYEDTTLYVMQSSSPGEQIAFGRSGSLVILGANLAAVQAAVDAQTGDSLDESDHYRQIAGDLPRDRALTVYTTGDEIRAFLAQAGSASPIPVNPAGLPLADFASVATTFSIIESGLQVDMVSYFDPEQLTAAQQALLDAADQPSGTAGLYPDQTLAYLAGQRLDLLWLAIREATGDEVGFDESMDAFGREFGVNPHTELFPLLNGEWAIGLIGGQSGLLAAELEIPLGFSVVAATDRPQELGDTVEAIRGSLEGQLLIVNEIETADLTSYEVSLSETAEPAFYFGLAQGYFFIASSEGAAVETFAGGPALVESEQYQAVQAEFSRGINPAFYVDVRTLLGTLRESRTGFDLLDFNEAVQVLEPVEAVALGNAYEGDLRRTQIIIFIETE